jgi:hypothetical protein
MSEYSLEKRLPSSFVTKELLQEIEHYIKSKCTSLHSESSKTAPPVFRFFIKDAFGSEHMSSVSDYGFSTLPEDTKGVGLSCGSYNSPLRVSVRFGTDSAFSTTEVQCNGSTAKELAHGVIESILKIVMGHRTRHHLLRLESWFRQGMTFVLALSGVIVLAKFGRLTSSDVVTVFWLVYVALVLAFIGLAKLCPYTMFDTKVNEHRRRWVGIIGVWLPTTLATGVVTSLVASAIWKKVGG